MTIPEVCLMAGLALISTVEVQMLHATRPVRESAALKAWLPHRAMI